MPTTINGKLISWTSDIEPGTIRQAERTPRLPIVGTAPQPHPGQVVLFVRSRVVMRRVVGALLVHGRRCV